MPMHVRFYELSEKADQDIDDIFVFTENKFGTDQAVTYVSEFDDVFKLLSTHPNSGKMRNEIKTGLRSFPHSSHMIFYRIFEDKIRIVRILHGSRDLPNFL